MTTKAVSAGLAYGATIFGLGFLLGMLRELALAPLIGRTAVVWVEAPLILLASWFAAGWLIRRFGVWPAPPARLTMGVVAMMLLLIGEAAVAVLGFGRTLAMHLSSYLTARGALELLPQIAFAAMPLLHLVQERRP
jgi:hypothetical protein